MQIITLYFRDEQAKQMMGALMTVVERTTALFSSSDPMAATASSNEVLHIMINVLPGNELWLRHAPSLVPILRAFAGQSNVSGKLASRVTPQDAAILGGRLYEAGTSLIAEAARLIMPEQQYEDFMASWLTQRGVIGK